MTTAKSQSNKPYQITYFSGHQGYEVAIDAKCSETQCIARTRVQAVSRADALRQALKKFAEQGHMNQAQAASYANNIKAGSKSVRQSCARG